MIYLFVLLIALIVGIVNYVFRGMGMYHMAKREGMDYLWLALFRLPERIFRVNWAEQCI